VLLPPEAEIPLETHHDWTRYFFEETFSRKKEVADEISAKYDPAEKGDCSTDNPQRDSPSRTDLFVLVPQPLLIIDNQLRHRFARGKLRTHFLDLPA
jgi:hypothetical protein